LTASLTAFPGAAVRRVERDLPFVAGKSIAAYTEEARALRRIIA